jgi:hypothetical protein
MVLPGDNESATADTKLENPSAFSVVECIDGFSVAHNDFSDVLTDELTHVS